MYEALEGVGQLALPAEGWDAALDPGLLSNLGRYRRYNFASLRDLLRVIRNKHSHFRELPPELQQRVGPLPGGFLAYFTSRFPQLLLCCYYFAARWLAHDPVFRKYLPVRESLELAEKLGPPADLRRVVPDPPGPPSPIPAEGGPRDDGLIVWDMGTLPRRPGQPVCDFYAKTGRLGLCFW